VIKMLVFTFSLAFILNFSLSNFIVSPYKLVLFGIIFCPLTYLFLFQRNLISKELFRRILSKN
jgi:hypothetical protein